MVCTLAHRVADLGNRLFPHSSMAVRTLYSILSVWHARGADKSSLVDGTGVEGEYGQVMKVIQACHEAIHAMGCVSLDKRRQTLRPLADPRSPASFSRGLRQVRSVPELYPRGTR